MSAEGRKGRPGRRALFSDPSGSAGRPGASRRPAAETDGEAVAGRRALFSGAVGGPARSPGGRPAPADRRGSATAPEGRAAMAVVHCRTCLSATSVPLAALVVGLIPSLWLPGRPWSRLMRCPHCHRVAWCRIDWPRPGRR